MKQKLKATTTLVTLFLLSVLSGCQKDVDENENQNQYAIKKYSFEQANRIQKFNLANKKITNDIQILKSKHSTTNKEETLDYKIDSTTIKEISIGDYTTYTMLIEREQPSEGYFENLIIEIKPEATTAYLIKYTPTEEPTYIPDHDEYSFVGTVSSKILAGLNPTTGLPYGLEDGSQWSSGDGTGGTGGSSGGSSYYSCATILLCDRDIYGALGPIHPAGARCTHVYSEQQCNIYSGPASTTPYNSSTHTGNTSSNPSNPVNPVTSVVVPPDPPHCIKLLDLIDPTKANIKSNIDWLKTKVNDPLNTVEHGVEFEKHNYSSTYTNTNTSSPYQNTTPLSFGENVYGGAHCHTLKGHPMFSFGDVELFSKMYRDATTANKKDAVLMLVCRTSLVPNVISTYALKVEDITVLYESIKAEYLKYASTPEGDRKFKILEDEGKLYDKCNNEFEKTFLQQFASFGISLYKASDNLDSWTKQVLSPTDPSLPNAITTVNSIPCN